MAMKFAEAEAANARRLEGVEDFRAREAIAASIDTVPARYNEPGYVLEQLTDGRTHVVRGVMTTDHAMSSHGLPVFVTDDGRTLGPADLPAPLTYVGVLGLPLIDAARAAGYRFQP